VPGRSEFPREHRLIVEDDAEEGSMVRAPSPKKSPGPSIATTASLPARDDTEIDGG
jgi:hypothetical protein